MFHMIETSCKDFLNQFGPNITYLIDKYDMNSFANICVQATF